MGIFDKNDDLAISHYPWTDDLIKAFQASHWTDQEFSFKSDVHDFHSEMSTRQRQVFMRTMSAISQIEVAVKRFWANLDVMFPHHEMSDLGFTLASTEVIHGRAYRRVLDELNMTEYFRENLEAPVFSRRVAYLRKYANKIEGFDSRQQTVYALLLFTMFVENVSLFTQFYIARHYNRFHRLMPDCGNQVAYTAHEETLHAQTGALIIRQIRNEYPDLFDDDMYKRVIDSSIEAYSVECDLINWMLDGYTDEALTGDHLRAFLKSRMSESIVMCGYSAPSEFELNAEEQELLKETLWFDEGIKATAQVDFFQVKSVAYVKGADFTHNSLAGALNSETLI